MITFKRQFIMKTGRTQIIKYISILVLFSIWWLGNNWVHYLLIDREKGEVLTRIDRQSNNLSNELNRRIHALEWLSVHLQSAEPVNQRQMYLYFNELKNYAPGISALVLSNPENRIIQTDSFRTQKQLENILDGIERQPVDSARKVFLAHFINPVDSITEILVRKNIRFKSGDAAFLYLVFDLQTVIRQSVPAADSLLYISALFDDKKNILWGAENLETDKSVNTTLQFMNLNWLLSAYPHSGWEEAIQSDYNIFRVGSFLVGLLIILLIFRYARHSNPYNNIFNSQTRQQEMKSLPCDETVRALQESELRYRTIFNSVPVSIWEEDLSDVLDYIEQLRCEGVVDFQEWVDNHPEKLREIVSRIKVIDVNDATLTMFEADSKEEMLASIDKVFVEESFEVFGKEFVAIATGQREFKAESQNKTLKGRPIEILIIINIPSEHTNFEHLMVSIFDITEFRRTRREVIELQQRNEKILQTTLDGYLLVDDHGRILDVNVSYCNMIGYTREELLQKNLHDIEAGLSPEDVDRRIRRIMSIGKDRFFTAHRHKTGKRVELDVSITTIDFNAQKLISAFVRDISEQLKAEEGRRRSEESLAIAQRIAHIGNWDFDIVNNKLEWSDEINRLFALTPQSPGVDYAAFLERIHPDDRRKVTVAVERALKENENYHVTFRIMLPDGDERIAYAQAEVYSDEDGKPLRLIGTVQDVTIRETALARLKESEERYRSLVSNAPDFICIVDREYKLQYLNRLLPGFTESEVLSTSVFEYTDQAYHTLIRQKLEDAFKTGKPQHYETKGMGAKGEERWYSTRIGPITQEGTVRAVTMISSDITESKKAQQEIQQRSEELAIIARISNAVTTNLDLDVILNRALEGALELTGLKSGTLCLISEDESHLQVVARKNTTPENIAYLTHGKIKIGKCLCGNVVKTNEPLILWDNASGSKYAMFDSVREAGIRFHAAFPLLVRDKSIGILCIFAVDERQPTRRSLKILEDLCPTIALAIENAVLYKKTIEHAAILEKEVAERRKAEQALRNSEQRFRHLVDRGWDLIVMSDESGNIKYVNESIQRILGYSVSEFREIGGFAMAHPNDLIKIEKDMQKLLLPGVESLVNEYRVRHKDGSYRWLEVVGTNFLDDKSVNAIVANCRDITERKKAEARVRRSRQNLKESNISLQTVNRIAGELHKTFAADEVLKRAIDSLAHFSKNHSVVIYMANDNKDRLILKNLQGTATTDSVFPDSLPGDTGLAGTAFSQNVLTWTSNIQEDKRILQTIKNVMYELKIRSAVFFPITYQQEVFGVVGMAFRHRYAPGTKDRDTFLAIGQTIGLALSNAMQVARIEHEVRERRKAEKELRDHREQLRQLSAHLQSVREEERASIAREIHDELAQVLTALKMDLVILGREIEEQAAPKAPDMIREIEAMKKMIDNSIQQVRRLISELRPDLLANLGIIETIEWQLKEFENRTGIHCKFENNTEYLELERDRSIALYRIVQEALTNISRYAKADRVSVSIARKNGRVLLFIEDNGIGIAGYPLENGKGYGLLGMKERTYILGGQLKIYSEKGKGTRIEVNIPFQSADEINKDGQP